MAGAVAGLVGGISMGSVDVTGAAALAVAVASALMLWQGARLVRMTLQG
jgi:hypothetical protein